ncbi:MAG: Flp family type IVb pilin [Alicyclobacillus sp.]|nr:Flp family type IVb pilin [Alicyclobacillus sp.]
MRKWLSKVYRTVRAEEGQSLVEYGLIIALIALVVIGVLAAIGGHLSTLFSNISNTLSSS